MLVQRLLIILILSQTFFDLWHYPLEFNSFKENLNENKEEEISTIDLPFRYLITELNKWSGPSYI